MPAEWAALGHIVVKSSAAVALAAVGEVVTERSGVLNLGVEGMMLLGALAGAAAAHASGDPCLGLAAGAWPGAPCRGACPLRITLAADQTLSGLALAILARAWPTSWAGPWWARWACACRCGRCPAWPTCPSWAGAVLPHPARVPGPARRAPGGWVLARTRWGSWCGRWARTQPRPTPWACPWLRFAPAHPVRRGHGRPGRGLPVPGLHPGWKENMSGGQGWIAIAMSSSRAGAPCARPWARCSSGLSPP